jgi:RNA polymerase sigma-70 factor, ECF subfamily
VNRVEAIFRSEHAKLWRALVAFTGQPEVASDAVGEAFAQLLSRGDAVRDASAWVWKTSFRIAAGELKKQSRPLPSMSLDSYQPSESLLDLIVALRKLSPRQRLAVILHDYADHTAEEVGTIMGVTRATVYVHLSQGRARLRKTLEEGR